MLRYRLVSNGTVGAGPTWEEAGPEAAVALCNIASSPRFSFNFRLLAQAKEVVSEM